MIIEIPRVESLEDLRRRINEVLRLIDEKLSEGAITSSKPVSGLESRFYADMTILENIKEHSYLEDLARKTQDVIQNISGTAKVQTTFSGVVVQIDGISVFFANASSVTVSGKFEALDGIYGQDYFAGDGSQGITANRSFVDYSGYTHNVEIKDGLITSWTVT